jgi:hypothetical protein
MRVWFRTSRNTGVSLGCLGLAVFGPFLVLGWAVYAAALVVYALGWAVVQGIEAIGRRAEERQARRHAGTMRPPRPRER